MDVQTLLAEAKIRFNHNVAKETLKEKYNSKLIIAEQGGLWKASPELISVLNTFDTEKIVLIDQHNTPVEVERVLLLDKIKTVYINVMNDFYKEWKDVESKR